MTVSRACFSSSLRRVAASKLELEVVVGAAFVFVESRTPSIGRTVWAESAITTPLGHSSSTSPSAKRAVSRSRPPSAAT